MHDTPKARSSAREQASALVREIVLQEREAAAERRREQGAAPKRRRALPWVLALVFLALLGWNVQRILWPDVVAPERVGASARFAVYLAAQAIEAYRDSARALPPTLAVVGADREGLEYRPGDTSYTLLIGTGTEVIIYHSGEPLEPYAAALGALEARP